MIWNMISQKKGAPAQSQIAQKLYHYPRVRSGLAILVGAICGALVGATAIGGGVLVVPILIILFGLSASQTVGSAIFLAFIMTFCAACVAKKTLRARAPRRRRETRRRGCGVARTPRRASLRTR